MRNELRVEIKKLHQSLGNTMIYVTHDQVEALTLADRIAVLKGGVLQQYASPHEIHRHPANLFDGGFIGSPAMNMIEGSLNRSGEGWRLDHASGSIDMGRYAFAGTPSGGPAVVGVRPESIAVGAAPAGHCAASGKVTIVEPMGGETILWTDFAGKPITIRVDGESEVKLGDEIPFHFDVARASAFDARTGLRL